MRYVLMAHVYDVDAVTRKQYLPVFFHPPKKSIFTVWPERCSASSVRADMC